MIKIGNKVLNKITKNEHVLTRIHMEEDGGMCYTFKRTTPEGTTHMSFTMEDRLEEVYYFTVEPHPSVQDETRRKSKKNREKVTQPSSEIGTEASPGLNLLN